MIRLIVFFSMICLGSWAQNRGGEEPSQQVHRKKYLVILRLPSVVQDSADLLAKKQMSRLSIQALSRDFQWLLSRDTEDFFLLNGFSVELTSREYEQLKREPRVRSLMDLSRDINLKKVETSPFELESQKPTTYGIEKINVKTLQVLHPHLMGAGVRVGILDTGIFAEHPDLKGKLVAYKNFSPATEDSPRDGFDHGTHVAGTIAGGSRSGQQIGVAPEASLIVGRIFDSGGDSTTESILRAMHWVVDPDGDPSTDDGAQIVNGSWGTREAFNTLDPHDDPFCQIISVWKNLSVMAVFAAGNNGPEEASVGLPGGCPDAIAVGATEQNDRLMYFSAVGPAKWKSFELNKPEVTAPGFQIVSASAEGGYRTQLGTSMSAPHVTGALAILKQAFPERPSEQVIEALLSTAQDLGIPGRDSDFGYGRIDALRAFQKLESSTSQH